MFETLGAGGIAFGMTIGWLIMGFGFYQKLGGRICGLTWFVAGVVLVNLASTAHGRQIGLEQHVSQLQPGDHTPWISTAIMISAALLGVVGRGIYCKVMDALKEKKLEHLRFSTRVGSLSFLTCWFAFLLHESSTSIPLDASRSALESAVTWCAVGSAILAGVTSWLRERAMRQHDMAKKIADCDKGEEPSKKL